MPRLGVRSDNLIHMKKLTATEAARGFSDLLDNVEESGETFLVMRRGRPVATISPAADGTGRALKTVLRGNRPDGDWANELRDLRKAVGSAEVDPWRG